jgi:haloalkane dehalogenase
MRLQGIGDPAATSNAELDAYLALIKGPDHGRAFLQIMRSSERTAAKQARYRAVVRDVPYPVQAVWAADDPTMTLAVYGEKARAAAGLPRVHTVPGKHFPQEDQAPALAGKIAELALRDQADAASGGTRLLPADYAGAGVDPAPGCGRR